jgi:hypothetical protein
MASVSENNPVRRLGSVMSLTDDCDQDITRVPNWHIFNPWCRSVRPLPLLGHLLRGIPLGVRIIMSTITVNCVSHNPGATIQEERI